MWTEMLRKQFLIDLAQALFAIVDKLVIVLTWHA